MKNSIFRKVRKHSLIIGGVTSIAFSVLIMSVLFSVRQFMVSESNKLSDLASQDARQMLINQAEIELIHIVDTRADISGAHLAAISNDVERMAAAASDILNSRLFTERQAMDFLKTYLLKNMIINIREDRAVYYGTETGMFYVVENTGDTPSNIDMRSRPWYIAAKEAGQLIWTDIYLDQEGRGQAITCAKPYYYADGRIAGVAGIGALINDIAGIIAESIGETGHSFILDKNGNIIIAEDLQYDEEGMPYHEYLSTNYNENLFAVVRRAHNGDKGIERVNVNGVNKLLAFQSMETMPWTFVVVIDEEEITSSAHLLESNIINLNKSSLASLNRQIIIITLVTAFLLVLLITVLLFVYNKLAKDITFPIQKLTSDAALISEGSLDLVLKIDTNDELETLADTFNLMIANIKSITIEREMLRNTALREQEANQLKSTFLAKMSHEIRTPMNAIIGMTELALREQKNAEKDEHILTVKQAASNLLAIINDILDFSKIEAGKMEIIPVEYSPVSLLNDIVSIIRMRVAESNIRFAVKADSRIPAVLYGDETRIRQAALNILNNAVKYTEEGYVVLSVHAEFASEDAVNIVFEVTDTGIGIKAEDIDKLFDNFAQFDLERNAGIEGVGLGLAITKSIVDAMEGSITVKSEYGSGSSFLMAIPQKYSCRRKIAQVENTSALCALIYERRDVYADSLEYAVKDLGLDCALVTSGTELFKEMENREYDFIFISYELYLKNKDTINKFGKNTRIVILTEFGENVPEKQMNMIVMPVYCSQIANIVNGGYGNMPYSTSKDLIVRFRAPEAKILVVDDINTNLKVTEGLLASYNFRVDLCSGGLAAIEAVKKERYDLVFMDHRMPGIDGVEATRRIREWEKEAASGKEQAAGGDVRKQSVLQTNTDNRQQNLQPATSCLLPIIALTANAVSGMMEMFIENGFNDFLSKPIDIGQLNAVLEKWIPKEKKELI